MPKRILSNLGKFGGTQHNNGGRVQGISGGQTITMLDVQGDDGCPESLVITMGASVDVRAEGDPASEVFPPVLNGYLSWGSDGGRVSKAKVDWKQGGILCVSGASVRLDCECLSGNATVSAFVGYGTRPGALPPTETISGLTNEIITIPDYAVALTALPSSNPSGYIVRYLDAASTLISYGAWFNVSRTLIPNNARKVQLLNDAATCVFEKQF